MRSSHILRMDPRGLLYLRHLAEYWDGKRPVHPNLSDYLSNSVDWAEEMSDALDRREEWEAGFQAPTSSDDPSQ
jgi:hypothetical protein